MTEAAPDCLFCRMVAGDITPDVVAETPTTLAFRDVNPQAPTHVLVVPRTHHATIGALAAADPGLAAELLAAAQAVAVQEGLATGSAPEPGWRLVVNSGPDAGQTVHHVHLHVLGGRGLGWPPG
ncbi:HIT domain-containing protein [Modestobacter sp. SSW1-42]|uniref:HIT domain-containing protein n=1 Tax=Modestobacter sp. SSW1-42 TaxID=596372 RepID=UPI003985963E